MLARSGCAGRAPNFGSRYDCICIIRNIASIANAIFADLRLILIYGCGAMVCDFCMALAQNLLTSQTSIGGSREQKQQNGSAARKQLAAGSPERDGWHFVRSTAAALWNDCHTCSFISNSDGFEYEMHKASQREAEISFLRGIARPGMIVVEAGAGNGRKTLALADAVGDTGHVYAFEPAPEYYRKLRDRVARSNISNVSIYNLALADHSERIPLYWRETGSSSIVPANGGEMLWLWVEATSIGEFFVVQQIERVDLICLDCEGSELLVLRGAQDVLKKHTPRVLCAIHREHDALAQPADDLTGYLSRLGYKVQHGMIVSDYLSRQGQHV